MLRVANRAATCSQVQRNFRWSTLSVNPEDWDLTNCRPLPTEVRCATPDQ